VADTARIIALLEAEVRKTPEQYLWAHRRFKTRPDGAGLAYGAELLKERHRGEVLVLVWVVGVGESAEAVLVLVVGVSQSRVARARAEPLANTNNPHQHPLCDTEPSCHSQ